MEENAQINLLRDYMLSQRQYTLAIALTTTFLAAERNKSVALRSYILKELALDHEND